MKTVVVGLSLMMLGLLGLFAMVVQLLAPGLVLALAAYGAAFGGLLLAVFGAAQRLRPR